MNVNSYSMSDVLSQYIALYQPSEGLADIVEELVTEGISVKNLQQLRSRIKMLRPDHKGQVRADRASLIRANIESTAIKA